MNMSEEEYDDYYAPEPELDEPPTSAHSDRSRYFFALMSFLVALIFLSTYLNNAYDPLSGWLLPLSTAAFAAVGVLFLVPNSIFNRPMTPGSTSSISSDDNNLQEAETGDSFVEGKLSSFELLVEEALSSIPAAFHEEM